MLKIKNKKDCTGCSACYSTCPTQAIAMIEDDEGFVYPQIDETKCIKCGLCEKTCPCIKEKKNNNYIKPKILAAWSLDKDNKLESSSGGCFYELAKYVLKQGGAVIGAGFDNELNVIHKVAESKEELLELKGSKYVQSKIDNAFINAKNILKKDRFLLFVGTPCQVAGLYAYLGNNKFDKLYTADLICHGAPSPKVYRKYLNEIKAKYKTKPTKISFRDKTYGWKRYSMKIIFNDKVYIERASENSYIRGFLSDLYLRPSCYDCKFSKLPRIGDITLGDFWGINNIESDLDDDIGTSELIINSDKGEYLMEKINSSVFVKEMDLDAGTKYNPSLICSSKEPKKRVEFFEQLDKQTFDKLSKRYFPKRAFIIRIVGKVKNKLHSFIKSENKRTESMKC